LFTVHLLLKDFFANVGILFLNVFRFSVDSIPNIEALEPNAILIIVIIKSLFNFHEEKKRKE